MTRGAAHHDLMPAPRTAALVVIAALALSAAGLQAWRAGQHGAQSLQAAPESASSQPASGGAAPGGAAQGASPSGAPAPGAVVLAPPDDTGGAQLEAARVLHLFCVFVDSHRYARARTLLLARVWPLRELRAFSSFRFVSARVYARPDARTLIMLTRIRIETRSPSPLADGVATLFFTLGRVGTTTGGWLITAVSSSP